MLLTIYDKAGTKRADVAVNDSSTQSKEVQGDNVLSLSFSYYAFLPLDVNDYTDYLGERYWLTERYTPKQVSDGEWEYNLNLYGIESLIKRFLVLDDSSFSISLSSTTTNCQLLLRLELGDIKAAFIKATTSS